MSRRFEATPYDESERLLEVSRKTPGSPFNTREYAEASRSRGQAPFCLATVDDDGVVEGCLGLLSSGPWRRRLEMPSAPALSDPACFWGGLEEFCRGQGVTDIEVNSFASDAVSLPDYGRELHHAVRTEFLIDIKPDILDDLTRSHRRNARRAKKSGLTVRRSRELAACDDHLRLMRESTDRRSARGETVETPTDGSLHYALLEARAGELFQACSEDAVLSSILVLRGPSAAYQHSAGTSPEGMKGGASPFLIVETVKQLADERLETYNLGGADPDAEGLRQFKTAFGAREVPLEAATYSMISSGDRLLRKLRHGIARVISGR